MTSREGSYLSPGVGSLGPVREIKRYCEAHNIVVER